MVNKIKKYITVIIGVIEVAIKNQYEGLKEALEL